MNLELPERAVPDRVSVCGHVQMLQPFERRTLAELDGPGCIRHIWVTMTRSEMTNRKAIIRIFFDGESTPHVEAPVGDFFGVMHGKTWYPIDTPYLSVKAESGYNCYFAMPFATSARIEFECGDTRCPVYLMVDWHRYPGQELREPRRFCARWRREVPAERYGEDFMMLDADGPGRLVGFVYGVRLLDDTDRWSHGGADNIYIDGEGEHPAYLRGIGGEDVFGTSYGGALHPPETHLYTGMPYYVHDDVGQARPAQRLVGYRFFEHDAVEFRESIHMRFGCMRNDICSTVYWYQERPVRPFFEMPEWDALLPGAKLPRGTCDLALPASGHWWLCGPFDNTNEQPPPTDARWQKRASVHGFVDFNHVLRPHEIGVAPTHAGMGIARCRLDAPSDIAAKLRIAWDDRLVLCVNDDPPVDLGQHAAFRAEDVAVSLRAGPNTVALKLSNTIGSNHGGWAFAFRAETLDGNPLLPSAD
jgi:Protein of unknown function (DUF2961)